MTPSDLEAIERRARARVQELKTFVASLPSLRDARSERERADNATMRLEVETLISRLCNHDLDKPLSQRIAMEMDLAEANARLATIRTERAAIPDTFNTSVERDRQHDAVQHSLLQEQLLQEGRLLKAAGVCYCAPATATARIAELDKKIATLVARHATYMRQAETILSAVAK